MEQKGTTLTRSNKHPHVHVKSKINDTKDVMKKKASEIDKSKVPLLAQSCQRLNLAHLYSAIVHQPDFFFAMRGQQVEKMREGGGGGGGKNFPGLGSISSSGGLGGFMSELEGEVRDDAHVYTAKRQPRVSGFLAHTRPFR